jgi:hypothetical protein
MPDLRFQRLILIAMLLVLRVSPAISLPEEISCFSTIGPDQLAQYEDIFTLELELGNSRLKQYLHLRCPVISPDTVPLRIIYQVGPDPGDPLTSEIWATLKPQDRDGHWDWVLSFNLDKIRDARLLIEDDLSVYCVPLWDYILDYIDIMAIGKVSYGLACPLSGGYSASLDIQVLLKGSSEAAVTTEIRGKLIPDGSQGLWFLVQNDEVECGGGANHRLVDYLQNENAEQIMEEWLEGLEEQR